MEGELYSRRQIFPLFMAPIVGLPRVEERFAYFLHTISLDPSDIGGRTSYYYPLEFGMGYATHEGGESTVFVGPFNNQRSIIKQELRKNKGRQELLSPRLRSVYDFTGGEKWEEVSRDQRMKQLVLSRLVETQQQLPVLDALDSQNVIGFGSTRSPEDIGRKYALFRTTAPGEEPKFHGIVFIIDCPKREDWNNHLAFSRSHTSVEVDRLRKRKWNLPWIADLSTNVFNSTSWNTGHGLTGVVMVSGDLCRKYLLNGQIPQ